MSKQNILIFGATGRTGVYAVREALENGFRVRVVVRSEQKLLRRLGTIDFKNRSVLKNMEVIEGDMTDSGIVDESVRDQDYVLVVAGGPHSNKNYPKGMMENFIRDLVPSMRKYNCNRLVYQAGGFSPMSTKPLSIMESFMRSTMSFIMGIKYMLQDNDEVIQYLEGSCYDINWTVTRPGMLKEGSLSKPSRGIAKGSYKMPMGSVNFCDLAKYSIRELVSEDDAYKHCGPYVIYDKTH
jgi:nucleoside-diphosphate-sugar epimerase